MTEQTVAIYCFLDDFLRIAHPQAADKRRRVSDAELLTTALLSARYFGGNLTVAAAYMRQHHGMKSLDKSGLCRHLHRLADVLWAVFQALGDTLKDLNTSARYVIDSFPVAVCDNMRIKRCKLLTGKAYHGYTASKRRYFYGFKVQLVTTADGVPVDFYVHAGAEADQTGLRALAPQLPEGAVLYADAGYTDYLTEDVWADTGQQTLLAARKGNSKRPHDPAQAFLIQHFRKRVETSISGITALFPKKIHAVTAKGFALKLLLFIFAYTLYTQLD